MRRRSLLLPLPFLLVPVLAGCPMPTTGIAAAQQTAQDFNMDARLGRNESLIEQVAPTERDEYALHHRAWGNGVRIADVEFGGMKKHGDQDVDIVVRITWYRPEQQELRNTTLKQQWHPKGIGWELLAEQRVDGDIGLLGEQVVIEAPPAPKGPSQFPTVRLTGSDPQQD
jgi:hypothetical protein